MANPLMTVTLNLSFLTTAAGEWEGKFLPSVRVVGHPLDNIVQSIVIHWTTTCTVT